MEDLCSTQCQGGIGAFPSRTASFSPHGHAHAPCWLLPVLHEHTPCSQPFPLSVPGNPNVRVKAGDWEELRTSPEAPG